MRGAVRGGITMSWQTITIKYPGKCLICKESIRVGERVLWSNGVGVKHASCTAQGQMACAICGMPAGCASCEYGDICDIPNVSPLCICRSCGNRADPFVAYRRSVGKKFPVLSGSNS